MNATTRHRDWTVDPATGRSNSSPKFQELTAAVTRLIKDDAASLLNGRADNTAGLILAQLAHVHHFGPCPALQDSATIDLDELQEEAEKLLDLLKNREQGLSTWNDFLALRLRNLHQLSSTALGL